MFIAVVSFFTAILIVRLVKLYLNRREKTSDDNGVNQELAEFLREKHMQSAMIKTDDRESGGAYNAAFAVDLIDREVDESIAEDAIRELSKWFNLRGLEAKKATVEVRCCENQSDLFQEFWNEHVVSSPRIEQLTAICELQLEFCHD